MAKTSLRRLVRRPLQSTLMLLSIAIGVSVAIAIDLANSSALRAFDLSTQAVVGRATHQIRGQISVDLYRDLRLELGIRRSAPIVEGVGLAFEQPVRLLGVDPIAEAPFRDYFPADSLLEPGFERFYAREAGVILMQAFAGRHTLKPGDSLALQVNDQMAELEVLGVLGPRSDAERYVPDDLFILDVATAQELLGMEGRLSRIDLILEGDQPQRLEQWLPAGLQLTAASEQAEAAESLTAAFRLNLQALSLLALFVGTFLVYNSSAFTVLQRRPVFGTLRTLGATRSQIFSTVIWEASAVGLIGGALGLLFGWLLAQGAVDLVTQTITDLYFVVSVRQLQFERALLFKGLLLGIGASLLGAALPALEAAAVPPAVARQRAGLERRVSIWLPRLRFLSLASLVGGSVTVLFSRDSISASFAGIFAVLFGIALITPEAGILISHWGRPVLRQMGRVYGDLASRSMTRNLSRTGVAMAALMVALAVTIGVSLMISSFRSTVENWLDLTLRADLYVSSPADIGTQPSASLRPELAPMAAQVEGVESVESYRTVLVDSEYGDIYLTVVDAQRERQAGIYRLANGTPGEVWQRVRQGSVIISEPLAYSNDLQLQDGSITLSTDQGPHEFSVEAIYYDYAATRGSVIMSRETYARHWQDQSISSLGVFLGETKQKQEVITGLRGVLAGTGLLIQDNQAVRQEALRIFDRTFAITLALRLLAILVAFIGVFSATMALQIERARELATMRAVGMTRRGLARLSLLESGLMGIAAALVSFPAGLLLSWLLIHVINLRSFGWTIRLQAEPQVFLQALLVGVSASILATIYPHLRLTQRPVAESLRGD